MRSATIQFVFLGLLFVAQPVLGDPAMRKSAGELTLSDLKPADKGAKLKKDKEDIDSKMVLPPKIPADPSSTRITVDATCTDSRKVTRNSKDPFFKDCMEERPRVANPPLPISDPSQTTFGVRLSR